MKLRLKTDFVDYYDHHFDRTGKVFNRFSRNDMTRRDIFQTLKKDLKMNVPMHGVCSEMKEHFRPDDRVVVYTDEFAHCGEGKYLVHYDEALARYPNNLISEYLKGEIRSMSLRLLSIGSKVFFLGYYSDDLWRSNCGNVTIKILNSFDCVEDQCNLPLYAIDFIKDCGVFYAVDLNTSPGIKGTGIEDILKPAEVVKLIKDKMGK